MSNKDAERIIRIQSALIEQALKSPEEGLTLKELSAAANIPYGSIRALLEHRDCWKAYDWTKKEIDVRDRSYGYVIRTRLVDAVIASRHLLVEQIKQKEDMS